MTSQLVILLTNNSLEVFNPYTSSVQNIEFPLDAVRDLELISKEKLDFLIRSFIDINKLAQTTIIFLLSDTTYFEKDIAGIQNPSDTVQEDQIQKFFDNIPFENEVTRIYQLDKGFKVIAANRDLCAGIMSPFEKYGFQFSSITPIFIFGRPIAHLDIDIVNFSLTKMDWLKQYTLYIRGDELVQTPQTKKEEVAKPKKNKKLILYLIIFFVLIGVLGFMLYSNFVQSSKTPQPQAVRTLSQ